jgi:Autotransporter beta-domain
MDRIAPAREGDVVWVSLSPLRNAAAAASTTAVRASVLALAIMAPARHAQAACTPPAPVNNVSVSCTGVTVDQNGTNGYGTGAENNLNITVVAGASVTGDTNGVALGSGNTLNNSGTITGGAGGSGITGDVNVINNASGTISGGQGVATGGNVINHGIILGTANGVVSTGIVTNYGLISGGDFGVIAPNVTVINSGTIIGNGALGAAVFATSGNATVSNSGTMSGNTFGVDANARNATVTNSGTITGGQIGIGAARLADVVNSGTISGATSEGITALLVNLTNTASGTIFGGFAGIRGGSLTINNSGAIVGGTGIIGQGSASTLVNSGKIIGTGGTAIDFSASSFDTLTFLPGTRVQGAILLGSGDTVNVTAGRDIAWLLSFTPTGPFSINPSGSAPFVVNGNQVATLDPTAYGMADRVLMDFSGAVSSMLGNRFDDLAWPASLAPGGSNAFAATPSDGIADQANAAFAGIPALAYAANKGPGMLPNATAVDPASGVAAWSQGFAGERQQQAEGAMLASTNSVYGGAIGVDRPFGSNLRLGAFVGAGYGRLGVDLNSQTIDTDYVFGGGYGRFDWSSHFLDFAISTGHTANASTRLVADNASPSGFDTATASYGGWYVSPELAYGVRLPLAANMMLIPIARVRYLGAALDGYTESGSAQDLSVAGRFVNDVEERFELDLARIDASNPVGVIKTTVKAGVLGLERLGDTTVNTVLIGQSLAFAAPGEKVTAGGFAGIDLDYRITTTVSLFASGEGALMTDGGVVGTVKGGARMVF